MKDLFIYHPGSGTFISLADPVYLVDTAALDEDALDELEMGVRVPPQYHKGIRIDNYNMTNLFFGGE